MLENKRPGLFPVAGSTGFVETCHGQSTGGFKNIGAVRVMALDTIHFTLGYGMMFRQMKLGIHLQVTFVAGLGVFAWIHNHFFSAGTTRSDMPAAGAVTGFATVLTTHANLFDVQAGVGTGGKDA